MSENKRTLVRNFFNALRNNTNTDAVDNLMELTI